MKRFQQIFITFFLALTLPSAIFAQACVGGQDPGCSPDDDCPCPIDNGVFVLAGIAIALAAKKTYDLRRKVSIQI